ncbi:MAG: hypothetical protein ABR611_12425 [Chthoniobacterales bacterium]
MKRFAILGVLLMLGGSLLTGCTTVPRDNNTNATTTSTSRTYSK